MNRSAGGRRNARRASPLRRHLLRSSRAPRLWRDQSHPPRPPPPSITPSPLGRIRQSHPACTASASETGTNGPQPWQPPEWEGSSPTTALLHCSSLWPTCWRGRNTPIGPSHCPPLVLRLLLQLVPAQVPALTSLPQAKLGLEGQGGQKSGAPRLLHRL